jgi:hypothetical protein
MTTDATPNSTQSGGAAVCSNLQLAGRSDWRLPTLAEWLTVGRGCDGTTGTKKAESFKSTCRLVSGTPTDCTTCPGNEGPGVNGCYWPTAMGVCNSTVYSYWTNTLYAGTYYYDISFSSAFVFQYVASQSQQIRCVLTK